MPTRLKQYKDKEKATKYRRRHRDKYYNRCKSDCSRIGKPWEEWELYMVTTCKYDEISDCELAEMLHRSIRAIQIKEVGIKGGQIMFVRKDTKQVVRGTLLVPFCKDCDSQDIETIQTCRKCGSHNITADWLDKRSEKTEYMNIDINIYKCDKCGKEFESKESPNVISFDGEFNPFMASDEYCEVQNYTLGKDLCEECTQKLVNSLNAELSRLTGDTHIREKLEEFVKEDTDSVQE